MGAQLNTLQPGTSQFPAQNTHFCILFTNGEFLMSKEKKELSLTHTASKMSETEVP